MTILFAQPYDLSASGFYFENAEDYAAKAAALHGDYGQIVEEFEIQFIDGESIDAELARAIGLSQCNLARFFEIVEDWDEGQKRRAIIGIGECGLSFDLADEDPDDLEIDLYEMDSLEDLARDFVEEGLFGEIPEPLRFYIDYEAIARDLACDYALTTVAGCPLIYACR